MKSEEEVEILFGEMRETTKEEQECIDKHLKDISETTGINLFDYLDKSDKRGRSNERNIIPCKADR